MPAFGGPHALGGATTGTGNLNMYASTIGFMPTVGVGIGTTVPSAALHIKNATSAMRITGNLTNASTRPAVSTTPGAFEIRGSGAFDASDDGFLRLSAGAGTSTAAQAYIDLSGYSTVSDMFENIVLGTQGVERMRITSAGNVGIGVAVPTSNLHVASGLTADFGGGLKTKYTNIGVTAASAVALNTVYFGTFSGSGPYTFTTNSAGGYGLFAIAYATPGTVYQISVTCYSSNVTSFSITDNNSVVHLVSPLTSTPTIYTTQGYANSNSVIYIGIATPAPAVGLAITFSSITVQRLDTVATGNVGIGKTAPSSALDITGNLYVNNGAAATTTGQYQGLQLFYTGTGATGYGSIIATNPGSSYNPISVNPFGGNVGIGITNPDMALDVRNTTSSDLRMIRAGFRFYTTYTTGDPVVAFRLGWYDDTWDIRGHRTDATAIQRLSFALNSSEKMCILPSGNVGIGLATPSTFLHVAGLKNSTTQSVLLLSNTIGGGYATNWFVGPNNYGSFLVLLDNGVGAYIVPNGQSWTSSSDIRLKDDITPLSNCLYNITKLRPVSYRMKKNPTAPLKIFGLIAQEVKPFLPEVVVENGIGDGMMGLTYTELVPVIIGAVQELASQVTSSASQIQELASQTAQIAAENIQLKSAIASLEARLAAAGL